MEMKFKLPLTKKKKKTKCKCICVWLSFNIKLIARSIQFEQQFMSYVQLINCDIFMTIQFNEETVKRSRMSHKTEEQIKRRSKQTIEECKR